MTICNICGGTEFIPTPAKRLGKGGKPPMCASCRSTERSRVVRTISEALRVKQKFSEYSLLIWGEQGGVAKGWFKSCEIFSADHADADLASRTDSSIDFILSINSLQKVQDPDQAVARMVRSLSVEGLILMSYPHPIGRLVTVEDENAIQSNSFSRRIIGQDFENKIVQLAPDAILVRFKVKDEVTEDFDITYLLTKNIYWIKRAFQVKLDAVIID